MLEKPNLPDQEIIASLRNSYGLSPDGIEFLPIGNDARAWVYRIHADGGIDYFLKVKKGTLYEPSVAVPRFLKDQGIEQVVAPLPTTDHNLWTRLGQFALVLYPFVDGKRGMQIGLTDQQWIEFGVVLKKIHTTRLPADLLAQVRRESFSPKWSDMVRAVQQKIDRREYGGPIEGELAAFWIERRDEIGRLVDRAEALGRMLQGKDLQFILCHSDIHTANILLDPGGAMAIVDWDDPLFAPKERDLMFVAGDIGASQSREEELFFEGYGATDIERLALAYYRYEWVVQEIGDDGERVFVTKDAGAETRKDAVRDFVELFQPGNVVEAAYKSDKALIRSRS
jgi:spectinomycin phosphotransferase